MRAVEFLFNAVHCSVIIGLHAVHCTTPTITLQSTAVHYIEQKIDFMCIFKEVISRAHKDSEASLLTYQVGAHFEALNEPVLKVPSDSRYTQVACNLSFIQVWWGP